ncbi:MAG: hypothetical protein ACM3SY_01635 [Candidatus Omnitrophota bacterium]
MDFNHTIMISKDDKGEGKKRLVDLMKARDVIWVIVLGNDARAQEAVQYADARAEVIVQGFRRQVIWIKDRSFFKDFPYKEVNISAGNSGFSIDQIDNILAFSISPDRVIMDVIKTTDPIDLLAMEETFLKAGV